jgi:putative flippase GtrA
MVQASSQSSAEIKRVGKFGLVGIFNTVIDFTTYNVLHFVAGWALIPANIVSTTCAMAFSFVANKQLVFKPEVGSWVRQAGIFFVTTAFGLYVLQNGTITLLVDYWTWPLAVGVGLVHTFHLDRWLSDQFVINNGAKAIATLVSLTWNYIIYKKVVFKT